MNSKSLTEELEKWMPKLLEYEGKQVVITSLLGKKEDIEWGELEKVEPIKSVTLSKGKGNHVHIPFLGYHSAIKTITNAEKSEILYENEQVKNSYSKKTLIILGKNAVLKF